MVSLLTLAAVAVAQPKDILFVSSGQELAQVNGDGTGLAVLNLQGQAPRWSPDGMKFAFLKLQSLSNFRLFVADADGSNPRPLDAAVSESTYQWSPDATRIAFLGNGNYDTGFELFLVDASGANLRSLAVRVGFIFISFGQFSPSFSPFNPFTWTPDGTQVLFVTPSGELSYVRVSDGAVTKLPLRGVEVAYHPGGNFFVFVGQRDSNAPPELFVSNPDGSAVRPLQIQGAHPLLSPNGQFLLFFTFDVNRFQWQAFILELSPTGDPVGSPVPLNVGGILAEGIFASWAPDDTRLVLSTDNGLVVVRRDGTGLTPLNTFGLEPQWRPPSLQQFIVATDTDSGTGSLREAINQANSASVPVRIRFQRPLTIRLQSPLPPLLNPKGINLDGDVNNDGTPDVVLDGSALPRRRQAPSDGLAINSAGNTVNSLVVRGFPGNGIVLDGSGATGNTVSNCIIENNGANGILIRNGASSNVVRGCTLQNNAGDGIRVEGNGSVANRLTPNAFKQNGRLAINLVGGTEDANGVTANDVGDADAGPNNLQNFPELTAAVAQNGNVLVKGRIDTPNPSTVTVQLYATTSPDPSGFGEGERALGSEISVGGDGTFQVLVSGVALNEFVTAVATDANGNTSEFSRAIPVTPSPPTPQLLSPTGGVVVSTTPLFRLRAPATAGLGRVQFLIELSQDNFTTIARTFDQSGDPTGWNKPFYAPDEEATFQLPSNAPLPEGTWQWRAKTKDIDRQVESGFSAPASFTAVSPPSPPNLLEPADNALASLNPTFRVQGTLPSGSPARLVYFLELSQDNFATVRTVEPGTVNGWDKSDYAPDEVATLTLPSAQGLTEGNWQWRVRAALASQPTVQSLPSPSRSFTALDNRNRIPAGLSLMGLPFIPTEPTRAGLGLAADTRVAVYDPTVSGNYRVDAAAEPLPVREGRAFWVRSTGAQSPQVRGMPFPFPVTVSLQQGWNAVGNPLPTPIAWRFTAPTAVRIRQGGQEFSLEEAIRKGLISPFVWVWNETANRYDLVYDAAILPAQTGDPFRNDIPAWRGFWLFARTSGLQLVIDRVPRSSVLAARSGLPKGDGFVVSLTVRKGGQVIGEGAIGVRSGVPNRLTTLPPPPAPHHSDNALVLDEGFVVDIRPTGQQRYIWALQMRDGDELRWQGAVPRGWQVLLVDVATGAQVNVRYQSHYRSDAGRRLLLIAQRESDQPLRIVNLQAQGTRGRGIQITFGLTAPARVKVIITTLTGRVVRVLEAGSRGAGTQQLLWRGETDGASPAPTGIYLLRLQATDEQGRQAQAVRTVTWR